MEPDIKSMTLNEYLEYEAEMERRSWRNDRSKIIPTKYEGAEFNSSNRDKSVTFDFSPYYEDAFTPQFFAQPLNTPNTHVDKKDFDLVKILDDLFRTGDENLSICEQDVDLEKEEAQVEDDDDEDTYDIWDITVEDVKRIRQFLTPNVPDEMDEVIQPLIPQPLHTTPPNDDYEADFNLTKDIEELERLLAKNPLSHFTEIQVDKDITSPECYTADLEHGLKHAVSSSYRANLGE
ncbi:hypothetical protein Tco_1088910 [Tanacetum coccineum]